MRRGGRQPIDGSVVADLWSRGLCGAAIAARVGATRQAVNRRIAMMGLRRPAPMHFTSDPRPVMPYHPFWTPQRDAIVWATQGKLSPICDVAEIIGKPVSEVQRRWHQMRSRSKYAPHVDGTLLRKYNAAHG